MSTRTYRSFALLADVYFMNFPLQARLELCFTSELILQRFRLALKVLAFAISLAPFQPSFVSFAFYFLKTK